MKRLLAKLPRSSSGSRDASANSSASRCPFDILEVSMTDAAGFSGLPLDESVRLADLALVSSAICFSGASSGLFISFLTGRARPPGAPLFNSTDGSASRPYQTMIRRISFHHVRASSSFRTEQTSFPFARAVPFHRPVFSNQNVRRTEADRHGTARTQSLESSRNPRPPANRRLFLPRNALLH